jgi:putative inorganic carbon (HCO3(-)) transporter
MRDLAFAFIWIGLLPLITVSANAGALVWVWTALLSPNEMLYGFLSDVPFNKIVALFTVFRIVSDKEKDPYFDITLVLLILLAMASTASWLSGLVSTEGSTDLYEKLLKEIVLAFVLTAVITTRARIDRLIIVIIIALGFLSVKEGLIFLLTGGGHHILGNGALGDNNGLAMVLLMIIPLIWYLARYSVVKIVRIGLWSTLALSLVTVLATYSRGGLIGMVVLGAFAIKNSRRRIASLCLVAVAAVTLYAMAPDTWFNRMDTIETADSDASFVGRIIAWKVSLLIALDNPLFGGGMHAVQDPFVWDTYVVDIDRVNFINTPPPVSSSAHAAHSIYFEILGDMGFVGLTLFLAIIGIALWNCRQLYRMSRAHPSLAWAGYLARMLQISLVVYLVTGAALSQGYLELLYMLIALVSRTYRTARLSLLEETAAEKTLRVGSARMRSGFESLTGPPPRLA